MNGKLLLGACIVLLLAADAAKEDEASKKDAEKMQGDWAAVSMIQDGTKYPDDDAQSFFRTVKGDEYTVFHFDQPLAKWKFRLDATKKPKTIDVLKPDDDKAPAVLGIYEFDGDKFKLCVAAPGKDRPTAFESKEGSGQTLSVWEREKKK
jgi:uncharacterized protein (TIGR03067 family)